MNIFIFEGIAGSGKTTLEQLLVRQIENAQIISEDETLMPIVDNRDPRKALRHLESIIQKVEGSPSEVVIIDRLHLTHAFRTDSDLESFSDIEAKLKTLGDAQIILLTNRQDAIRDRIEETIKYREGGWMQGARGAESIEEKTAYYTDQQERLVELADVTTLPCTVIDTTGKNWPSYIKQLEGRA
jgi:hypothetical protein